MENKLTADGERFFVSSSNLAQMSGATLAYIGDAVYELIVREYLAGMGQVKSGVLHKKALQFVSAKNQATAMDKILPLLTEDERTHYKRGRNAPISSAKLGEPTLHAKATGFEALIGYLYLSNKQARIKELFLQIIGEE